MKRTLLFICAGTLLTAATVGQALAVTSSGTIGATLTLTNGCLINGSPTRPHPEPLSAPPAHPPAIW